MLSLLFFSKIIKQKEVVYIYDRRHDEILHDLKEDMDQNGYEIRGATGEIDKFVIEKPYYWPNSRLSRGEIDFMGFDNEKNRIIAVEVKPNNKPGHIKEAYRQLWRDEVHFSNKYPDKEFRTCMKLGDEPLNEIIAMNEADMRSEVVKCFELEGRFNTISERKRFYREDGSTRGEVSVFAEDRDKEELALCNVAVYAKESLCQSAIDRIRNEIERLAYSEDYEGWSFAPYIYVNGIGRKKIDIVGEDITKPEVDYTILEDIIEEAPRWAHWAPNI